MIRIRGRSRSSQIQPDDDRALVGIELDEASERVGLNILMATSADFFVSAFGPSTNGCRMASCGNSGAQP